MPQARRMEEALKSAEAVNVCSLKAAIPNEVYESLEKEFDTIEEQ